MQLDGGAKGSRPEPQGIPLGSSPGAPLDDDGEAEREELLSELPLQRLDLSAPVLLVEVDGQSIHPVVGGETHRADPAFDPLGKCRLTRAGQTAHDDQSRSSTGSFPARIMVGALPAAAPPSNVLPRLRRRCPTAAPP